MRKLLVFFSRHRNCKNESQGVENKSELGDEKNRLLRNLYFFLQFDFAVMHEIRFAIQRLLLKFIKKIQLHKISFVFTRILLQNNFNEINVMIHTKGLVEMLMLSLFVHPLLSSFLLLVFCTAAASAFSIGFGTGRDVTCVVVILISRIGGQVSPFLTLQQPSF